MPKLNFVYSLELERGRVEYSFHKREWYVSNGYKPTFPGNQTIDDITDETLLDELIEGLKNEFNDKTYQDASKLIFDLWNTFTTKWPHQKLSETTLNFQDIYEIHLTRYGVGGSYNLPNSITINIERLNHEGLVRVIFHEMLHLAIEPYIKKYNTPHWNKERLVDLFFKKLLPEMATEQNLPKEALVVDSVFNTYYGDAEAMIKNLP